MAPIGKDARVIPRPRAWLVALGVVIAAAIALRSRPAATPLVHGARSPAPDGGLVPIADARLEAAAAYDLAADFSFARNPNGVWQYGYAATRSLAPEAFRLDAVTDVRGDVRFWHPSRIDTGGPGYYPYVAQNTAARTEADPTTSWAVRAGEVAMESDNDGRYAVVRFVAPRAGTYHVEADFAGAHFGLSTTDVHVVHGGASLFDADVDGYGGDPAFHEITGRRPTASYSGDVRLEERDVLAFAVGYGSNGTHFRDTTGLFVRIRPHSIP